ncbi:hypothetical protein K438DRAFT_1784895 [Mycena galopus ATCC 62051]|nr:hypothetical protein K438DRAFT_1784895 [Mycena galopus ATCC 62051]
MCSLRIRFGRIALFEENPSTIEQETGPRQKITDRSGEGSNSTRDHRYTAIGTTPGGHMPATCGRDVAGEWWPGAGQMMASINRKWPHRVDTSSWQAAIDARWETA